MHRAGRGRLHREAHPPAVAAGARAGGAAPDGHRLKFVVVEDNPDNMKLVRTVLAVRGHEIIGLPGGETLIEVVQAQRPDAILLDIQLPGEDGFALLEKLQKSFPRLPPVLALTAHAMSGDRERALAAGFDGYLTKPIDVRTFAMTVEGLVHSPHTP